MFFPYKDDNPLKHGPPWITLSIIGLCAVIYLFLQLPLGNNESRAFVIGYGFIPVLLFGDLTLPIDLAQIPTSFTLITCMFLHGGIMHLLGNMWFLWVFGDNVEDAMGPSRFILFYLLSGLVASAAQIATDTNSIIPMVGASGAIGGVMGAYALLYPRARVRTLVFLGFFITTLSVPAFFILAWWFVVQLVSGLPTLGRQGGGVAFWAHIGGFLAGILLVTLFRQRPSRTIGGT